MNNLKRNLVKEDLFDRTDQEVDKESFLCFLGCGAGWEGAVEARLS